LGSFRRKWSIKNSESSVFKLKLKLLIKQMDFVYLQL